jgi:hypothetical protein
MTITNNYYNHPELLYVAHKYIGWVVLPQLKNCIVALTSLEITVLYDTNAIVNSKLSNKIKRHFFKMITMSVYRHFFREEGAKLF